MCAALALASMAACRCDEPATTGGPAPSASASSSDEPAARLAPATRVGSTIARAADDRALFVADEDHAAIHRLPLPFDERAKPETTALPGPPAQLIALADRLLVTVRDPGLLLVMAIGPDGKLTESARVELPPDAWGLAVTADERRALVTSAWSAELSAVDLEQSARLWSIEVAREPRAVVVPAAGTHAYVSHLVGSAVTRIDGIEGAKPSIRRIELPPAPARAPRGETLAASLGYAAILSPDDGRLFVARHALGALGESGHLQRFIGFGADGFRSREPTWFGASTVDVLVTKDDRPLAPARAPGAATTLADLTSEDRPELDAPSPLLRGEHGPLPLTRAAGFVQPRAMVYRRSTRTLLVAAEGDDSLVELDALALEPALHDLRTHVVGGGYQKKFFVAESGGAPSGIALSKDEWIAYLFCRSTYDVVAVALDASKDGERRRVVRLAGDPLLEGVEKDDPRRSFREAARLGRRLFYNAVDSITSGGMGCAGCHPEGRDDGHTWREVDMQGFGGPRRGFVGGPGIASHGRTVQAVTSEGRARQTPMLAGRVRAKGPYGWLAEDDDLIARIRAGLKLHRWDVSSDLYAEFEGPGLARAQAIAAFLRAGLVPPPRTERALSAAEQRGRAVFESPATGCTACHVPESDYTDRAPVLVRIPERAGFFDESAVKFKTPSLLYVGGTPPYFHNGSVATLDQLVLANDDRMGKTSHLSHADKSALVAFLKTL